MSAEVETKARGTRRRMGGIVISDKMEKTIVVAVERMMLHPRVKKYVRRTTKVKAHDETNDAKVGDRVEVMETRPLSKDKCFRLVRVIERAKIPGQLMGDPTEPAPEQG